MQVVVLRHGIAEPRSSQDSEVEERERELTDRGRRRMRKGVKGLMRMLPRLDAIATSPLLRAVQTAEIAAERCGVKPFVLDALQPEGSHAAVARWLAEQRPDASVLLVGHSPDLEGLVCWLLAAVSTPFLGFSKGGAALLEIETEPGPGCAQLRGLLSARVLRTLA